MFYRSLCFQSFSNLFLYLLKFYIEKISSTNKNKPAYQSKKTLTKQKNAYQTKKKQKRFCIGSIGSVGSVVSVVSFGTKAFVLVRIETSYGGINFIL